MLILGIETSCDETAVALVRDGRLLGQELATQVDTHALFGGVVPEIASREHLRVLPRLYRELMRKTGVEACELDGVAVARGPGTARQPAGGGELRQGAEPGAAACR